MFTIVKVAERLTHGRAKKIGDGFRIFVEQCRWLVLSNDPFEPRVELACVNISTLIRVASSALLVLAGSGAASAFETPTVSARLVVAGGLTDGAYRAALELDLPAGWHTYWVNPGDAGIPPIFDVAKSANLKDFSVSYPAPVRYFDGTSTSMIYAGRLLLPIRAVPAWSGAPVDLSVRVLYGLCAEVCLPVETDIAVRLEPDAVVDDASAEVLKVAQSHVPVRVDDDRMAIDETLFDPSTGKGKLTVSVADDGRIADLFVTGPNRWFVAAPVPLGSAEGRRKFSVNLEGPSSAKTLAGLELHFVLTEAERAVEIVRRLDDSHR